VRDGTILARGFHERCGEGHAEVNAFLDAKENNVDVRGADMYVTLEPCSHYGKTPPCADRIIQEGIGRVVLAMLDPNPQVAGRGMEKLRQAGIEVKAGVLESEARKLNEVFLKYITTKEPFVFLKLAMSLDGKIATKTGQSQWISCEKSREQVHYIRNAYPAVLVGIGTVLKDDPMLNCRLEQAVRQPIRIIADSHLRIPIDCNIVKTAKEYRTIIAVSETICRENGPAQKQEALQEEVSSESRKKETKEPVLKNHGKHGGEEENDVLVNRMDAEEKIRLLRESGAELLFLPEKNGHIDLNVLMKKLGSMGIDGILLEGGADFAFAALQAGIVDKIRIYIAPKIIGGQKAKGCIGGEGIDELSEAVQLQDMKSYSCGEDIYLEGLVK
jgi:diaminohydroxyphosphoribosylaminopyrimidine deaminase/5-amino-6-(5-phosphoribosylamino)uracil reductase